MEKKSSELGGATANAALLPITSLPTSDGPDVERTIVTFMADANVIRGCIIVPCSLTSPVNSRVIVNEYRSVPPYMFGTLCDPSGNVYCV